MAYCEPIRQRLPNLGENLALARQRGNARLRAWASRMAVSTNH
jgi:hypothetical protein